jgi:hypothetical protein
MVPGNNPQCLAKPPAAALLPEKHRTPVQGETGENSYAP